MSSKSDAALDRAVQRAIARNNRDYVAEDARRRSVGEVSQAEEWHRQQSALRFLSAVIPSAMARRRAEGHGTVADESELLADLRGVATVLSASLNRRDNLIRELVARGVPSRRIGESAGLSHARVLQLAAKPDDD